MLRGGAGRVLVRWTSMRDHLPYLTHRSTSVNNIFNHIISCQGCAYRQLSTSQQPHSSTFPALPSWLTTRGSLRAMGSSSGSEDGRSSDAKPAMSAAPPGGTSGGTTASKPLDTIVKVQPTIKPNKPASKSRAKIDLNKSYTDNVFVTPLRAMTDYLLTMNDLQDLEKYKRRSPYPEVDDIYVLLRKDVENRAIYKWGSMEKMINERIRQDARQKRQKYGRKDKDMRETTGKPATKQNVETIFKSGTGRVVLYAVSVNALNAVLKFAAWMYTGSHSMFAEFVHSVADTVNQVILAIGVHQSLKQADTEHPYGWSNFRNVSSLISGVGIFFLGAGLSIYHGVSGILHPNDIESLYWALCILVGSFISEGATLVVAFNEVRHSAKKKNMTVKDYIFRSVDPSTNVVLLEDAAAVLGVVIAGTCMGVSSYMASPMPDAVGSVLIGTLLGSVASFIVYTNTIALVGRSIPLEKKVELMKELEDDRMIRALHDVKATEMGGSSVKFKAEVDFDGKEITRLYLEKQDLDRMMADLNSIDNVDKLETFMLKHGEHIVDTLGGEVDRIEKNLKKKHPEVRHVDLEQL